MPLYSVSYDIVARDEEHAMAKFHSMRIEGADPLISILEDDDPEAYEAEIAALK
jgi:hypothetical protein